jgi:ectoine hydroxylase-related dioxygenase (phytanoyl-CoA dioxygenase family)/2-polyprenyl-3-methyl-5-hydroxy-6-metoxy-1,4-benzoquinol methylase
MEIYNLHAKSYSALTQYYSELSEPMDILRHQILQTILKGSYMQAPVHKIGPTPLASNWLPAINKNMHILDVGCANGDNLAIMRQIGFLNLKGIDIAPEMVSAAKSRTDLDIECQNIMSYSGPTVDMIFAQALVHLFPKNELAGVLDKLFSMTKQRLYFSTTVHDQPQEGLEEKQHIVRYRSRYTKAELLTIIRGTLDKLNRGLDTWRVFYFYLTDPLGKNWINVVFDKFDFVEQYQNDGVIVYNGLFSQQIAAELNHEMQYFATNKPPANTWLRYDDGEHFDRVENVLPYLRSFHQQLFRSDEYMHLLEKCFGSKVALLKDKCNCKAAAKPGFPLHQDAAAGWEERGFGAKHLTVAISLEFVTLQNGALYFTPGIHNQGLFSPPRQRLSPEFFYKWPFTPVKMLPGDAVIFDSYTPHYSKENETNFSRKIMFLTYVDAKLGELAEKFFAEKRISSPPMDEREKSTNLTRDIFGKWVKQNP